MIRVNREVKLDTKYFVYVDLKVVDRIHSKIQTNDDFIVK